jgi:hypothetical protein
MISHELLLSVSGVWGCDITVDTNTICNIQNRAPCNCLQQLTNATAAACTSSWYTHYYSSWHAYRHWLLTIDVRLVVNTTDRGIDGQRINAGLVAGLPCIAAVAAVGSLGARTLCLAACRSISNGDKSVVSP